MLDVNEIYNADCLQVMQDIPDKSIQLIILDPPYFETKGDFDFIWDSFEDYLKDVEKWALACKRVLADNGTMFWFGSSKRIAYSQVILDKYFNLENSIVWENTNDHKQQIRFSEDLRSFAPLTERILMYGSLAQDTTGLKEVEKEYIAPRNPFAKELKKGRLKKGVSINAVAEYGKFYGNVNHGGSVTNWERGYNIPSKEHWKILCDNLPIERTEYDALRTEYEHLRRPFNNALHLGDVIRLPNYETSDYDHDTIKPEKLTRILITTCSRKNDLVVVPFAGSGTECAMSAKEGRNFIGFDIEQKHVDTSNRRCFEILRQPQLF